jgi:enoyl-CoA hydratase/carnithine racemase
MSTSEFIEPGEAVLYQKHGRVVVITMNRPEALNALNRRLRRELGGAILRFDADEEAQVAIITGAGRAFCAGRDLKERARDNAAGLQARAGDSMGPERPYMWPQTWKPLVAAINGYALAGGWAVAQMCDIRLAAEDARLGITEPRVGLLPPFAVILPRLLPMASVMELVLTAEPITAQRALEIGFVNRVVPREQLMAEAMQMAQKIAENAPLSLRYFKELAYRGLDMGVAGAASLTYHMYDRLLLGEDAKEGPRAFAEKRQPQWKGS